MAEVAVRAMRRAKERAVRAGILVARMEPYVGRRYDEDSVSAWINGRTVPPADALLAAAKAMNVSLDRELGLGEPPTDEIGQVVAEIASLRRELESVEDNLISLYSRVGHEYPHDRARTERRQERKAEQAG
jgi:transcriptional regulator with XRE-family HTH domain